MGLDEVFNILEGSKGCSKVVSSFKKTSRSFDSIRLCLRAVLIIANNLTAWITFLTISTRASNSSSLFEQPAGIVMTVIMHNIRTKTSKIFETDLQKC